MRALRKIRILLLALVAALAVAAPATAQRFPTLTGRVVDEAGILDQTTRSALAAMLATVERQTTDQLVVATVTSLQGNSIEVYANRLFNRWALGQRHKNNGVLVLVAPSERKVRIEVGDGLLGTLTNAVSKYIIDESMLPRFRAGDMTGGVATGVADIVSVLTGDAEAWKRRAAQPI
jgi:uncharacterized protein